MMNILFTEYLINIQKDIQKLYVAYIKDFPKKSCFARSLLILRISL